MRTPPDPTVGIGVHGLRMGKSTGSFSAVKHRHARTHTRRHRLTHVHARPDLVDDHLDGKVWVGPRRQGSETHHCGASSMVGISMAGSTGLTR